MSAARRRFLSGGLGMFAAAVLPRSAAAGSREDAALGLAGRHPADYYRAAAELFRAGRRDDAVFVFYLGQLRYRTYLAAHPDLPPDGDPALFASLSETVGRPLNEWAFGDIGALLATLDAVMAYDRSHPDSFTPRRAFRAASDTTRAGMRAFRDGIARRADSIRAERLGNGLPNR